MLSKTYENHIEVLHQSKNSEFRLRSFVIYNSNTLKSHNVKILKA